MQSPIDGGMGGGRVFHYNHYLWKTSTGFSSVLGADACLVFRERSESGDDTDTGYGRSKERRRGLVLSLILFKPWCLQNYLNGTTVLSWCSISFLFVVVKELELVSLYWGMQRKVLGCFPRALCFLFFRSIGKPRRQPVVLLAHAHPNCSKSFHIVTAFLSQHTHQAAKAHSPCLIPSQFLVSHLWAAKLWCTHKAISSYPQFNLLSSL